MILPPVPLVVGAKPVVDSENSKLLTGEVMRAKPLPTTFKEKSYTPTGLRPIIINFLINLVLFI